MAHVIYTHNGRVINLSALAEKLKEFGIPGASLSNLTRVFAGRHRPRFDLVRAIAKIGGIPLEEMDEALAHWKKQREQWAYVPSFGDMRRATVAQKQGQDKRSRKKKMRLA